MEAVRDEQCKKSFEELIRRYFSMIHQTCYRLTLDWHHAEDLAQEVMNRIYLHRHQYKPTAKFKSFAMTVAINRCRDFLRSRKSSLRNDTVELAALLESAPATPLELTEQAHHVRQALAQLPEVYREVLVLRHYEGLQFREIAELLDVPRGTVASRMAKALKLIESKIAHLNLELS